VRVNLVFVYYKRKVHLSHRYRSHDFSHDVTLNGGQRSPSRPSRFIPGDKARSTLWTGRLVDPRSGKESTEKRKISALLAWSSGPVFLNFFLRGGTPKNNCSYTEKPLRIKTKKNYRETVVSARRLLQYFQLPDKNHIYKAFPLQAWTGSSGSWRLGFQNF
jgi:hypothetical protein